MFPDDFATTPPELENLPWSFAPVGALLENLDEEYRRTQTIVGGSHAHLDMLAEVLPKIWSKSAWRTLLKVDTYLL
jgi:hypothetical protein